MELDGITCLVTGANRGIGLGIARRMAREPVRLLCGVRDVADARIAGLGEPVHLDLSSRASIEAGLADIGDIDLLINNAGTFTAGLLEEQDLDAIYNLLQVNLAAPIHLTRRLLPGMLRRGRGKIVLNSSVVAYANLPAVTTYSASKAGLSGFAESLRRELHDTPVSTLHVVTGGIDTDMLDATKQGLAPHFGDTVDSWDQHSPDEWGERIVDAITDDQNTLGPGGKAALGKLASHLPRQLLDTLSAHTFDR
jgi:short-subunit dehydrogenase